MPKSSFSSAQMPPAALFPPFANPMFKFAFVMFLPTPPFGLETSIMVDVIRFFSSCFGVIVLCFILSKHYFLLHAVCPFIFCQKTRREKTRASKHTFFPLSQYMVSPSFLLDSSSLTCREKAFTVHFSSAAYRRSSPVITVRHTQIFRVGMFRCGLYIFATQKSSVVSYPRWTFEASHAARRRMAVYTRQPAGSRTRPASRGTRRATAVTPQPALMSHDCPARLWRAEMGAGL